MTSDVPGPSWMNAEDWAGRLEAYRRQGRKNADIAGIAEYLEQRGPRKSRARADGVARSEEIGVVTRALYVSKDDEDGYLTRDADVLPTLRLVDAGDRLAVWSPLEGGVLHNPKGPGLRRFRLVASYARGTRHHADAFRAADLRKGRLVELKREPDNPHDRNAVALFVPGARERLGYVQRGHAAAIARRVDAGESLGGVSMRGPGPGSDDDTAFLLLGSAADLAVLLR